MSKADGSVYINTKIDTGGVSDGVQDIESAFKDLASAAENLSDEINREFKGIDASKLGEDISDSVEDGFDKAGDASENGSDKIQGDIDDIDPSDAADDISDEIKSGFKDAANSSDTYSDKIKDDLDDIGDKAEQAGRKIKGIDFKSLDFSSLSGFADSLGSQLGDMVGDSMGSALGAALGGALGGAVGEIVTGAIAEMGEALLEFGQESIELASDLQEVQNVVDVTFTTMSDDVNKFAEDALRSAGLSEKSAKKYMGSFGSMAKSFGFSEQSAYDMSKSLTQLTGDVASFYNMEHEEAAQKLTAVFTGETEALKEMGVVMTQTALDAYAMENGFGKVTSEMTEQEKVVLRYQFVLDSLSDAQGDFVSTQESWANQMTVLNEGWNQFKESIGKVLIEALEPLAAILSVILPLINWLTAKIAAASEDFTSFGDIIVWATGKLRKLFTPPEDAIREEMEKSISDVKDEVLGLGEEYENTAEKAEASAKIQIGLFEDIADAADMTGDEIIKIWMKQQKAFEEYGENLVKLVDEGIQPALLESISDGSQQSIQVAAALVDKMNEMGIDYVNEQFGLTQEARANAAKATELTKQYTAWCYAEMAKDAEKSFSDQTADAAEGTKRIQQYINNLKGRVIPIIFQYQTTGTIPSVVSGSTRSSYSGYNLDNASVPFLARGAVIPPNAPFMAVLGDQRNGTNIEAPLSTIQEALRTVMAEQSQNERPIEINFTGDLAALVRILYPEIKNANRRESIILGRTPTL